VPSQADRHLPPGLRKPLGRTGGGGLFLSGELGVGVDLPVEGQCGREVFFHGLSQAFFERIADRYRHGRTSGKGSMVKKCIWLSTIFKYRVRVTVSDTAEV
jgi:hypothetical protein